MHFVWCESVENILRDKTLLRERLSDCVAGSVSLFCVHPFSLIDMVLEKTSFWKKVSMLNPSSKRTSGNDPLWIIAMLRPSKAGVFQKLAGKFSLYCITVCWNKIS